MRRLISVLAAALLLTGCVEVPENIVKEKESREAVSQYVPEESSGQGSGGYERLTLDEIRARLGEDASKRYGSITIERANAGTAKAMPTYKAKLSCKDYNFEKLLDYFFADRFDLDDRSLYDHSDADPADGEPYVNPYNENEMLPPFPEVDGFWPYKDSTDSSAALAVFIRPDGTVYGEPDVRDDDIYNAWPGDGRRSLGHWYPESDDLTGISYTMKDGSDWALSDAVEFVEKFWNEEVSATDSEPYTYRVLRADVYQVSDGACGYYFKMKAYDAEGCGYETDNYQEFNIGEERAFAGKRYFAAAELRTVCICKEKINEFWKDRTLCRGELLDDGEKLLSLAAAASILEDTLAENINRSFETAELCYVISFDRYPDRDYGKPLKYSSVFALERCEPVARPYWRFKDNDSYTDWNYAMNIYVDAVTGEVIMLSLME